VYEGFDDYKGFRDYQGESDKRKETRKVRIRLPKKRALKLP
jgi:hypothetical protein